MKRRLWRHCEDGVTVSPQRWCWCWWWDEAIISKALPGANIRAAARIVNTHFSSPGGHGGGAGLGWTNDSVNLWPASLPRDRISYQQWHCNTVMSDRMVKIPPALQYLPVRAICHVSRLKELVRRWCPCSLQSSSPPRRCWLHFKTNNFPRYHPDN